MKLLPVVSLLALVLAGCSAGNPPAMQGYIEGTYVYIAPEAMGRIIARPAIAGAPVKEGDVLARLNDDDEKQAVAAAEARLAQAQSQLADLTSGKRPEEIAVLVAQLNQARTALSSASDDYNRKLVLHEKGVETDADVDNARSLRDSDQAQVDAAERQLDVGRLPARPDEITAAERNVAAEEAALAQARIALDRRTLHAPATGSIEETFYEPGELVAAGQPILSLLPDINKKIRFFLPETLLAGVKVGSTITVTCDGCATGLSGEVTFVATEAEFTPPVLYSRGNREKLVYRVEAKPLGDAAALKVGQPVDVALAGAGS